MKLLDKDFDPKVIPDEKAKVLRLDIIVPCKEQEGELNPVFVFYPPNSPIVSTCHKVILTPEEEAQCRRIEEAFFAMQDFIAERRNSFSVTARKP